MAGGADMKKLILATTASVVLAGGSAGAADMAVRGPILQPSCAAKKFEGGYVGIHGGTAKHTANRTDQDGYLFIVPGTHVQRDWGFLVGAHAGWNFTTCSTLFGVEIDGSWVDVDQTLRLFPNLPGADITLRSRLDGLATARVRTGLALDNVLLYITGGFAAIHSRTDWHTNFFGGPETLSWRDWDWGWVAGFGSEWAWSERISLRSEVLYIETIDQDHTRFSPIAGNVRFTNSDSIWVGRLGLNVKFGPFGP
jgi:outer membrane immunogenic protein